MDIEFKTDKLAKLCNNRRESIKAWGERRAKIVGMRLDDMRAAVTLDDLRHAPGDCHEYRHLRAHELTLDLDSGWRITFEPRHDPIPLLPDGVSLDWTRVTCVRILKVDNPHGKKRK